MYITSSPLSFRRTKPLNPEAEAWKPTKVSQLFVPQLPYYVNLRVPFSDPFSIITAARPCTQVMQTVDCFYAAGPPAVHGGGKAAGGGVKMSLLEEELWGNVAGNGGIGSRRETKRCVLKKPKNNVGKGKSCFRTRSRIPANLWKRKLPSYEAGLDRVPAGSGGALIPTPVEEMSYPPKTTVMIKNIPNKLRRDFMIQFVDKYCKQYSLEYDFLYLPIDFRTKGNFGYAFVNFTTGAAAMKFKTIMQNYEWVIVETVQGKFSSNKICDMSWARIQGKAALMKRFKNCRFPCAKLEYLPLAFDPPRNGIDTEPRQGMVVGCACLANLSRP